MRTSVILDVGVQVKLGDVCDCELARHVRTLSNPQIEAAISPQPDDAVTFFSAGWQRLYL